MPHVERGVTDTTEVNERVERTVHRHAGTATQEVVEKVHRQAPKIAPSQIRAAVWELVGSGRITMGWDARLHPSQSKAEGHLPTSPAHEKSGAKSKATSSRSRAAERS